MISKYAGVSLHTPPVLRYPAPLFPFSPAAMQGMRCYRVTLLLLYNSSHGFDGYVDAGCDLLVH